MNVLNLKKWVPLFVILLIAVGGVAYWINDEVQYAARVTPVRPDIDFRTFLDRHAAIRSIHEFQFMGETHYAVVGDPDSGLALPSGPPVYIFNADLVLIDWVADSGESDRLERMYPGWYTGTPSSARELLERDDME